MHSFISKRLLNQDGKWINAGFYYAASWEMAPLLCHLLSSVPIPSQTPVFNMLCRYHLFLLDHLMPFSYGHDILENYEKYLLLNENSRCKGIFFIYKCFVKSSNSSFNYSYYCQLLAEEVLLSKSVTCLVIRWAEKSQNQNEDNFQGI